MRPDTLLFLACGWLMIPCSLSAQTLRGRVTDASTGTPVAAATLSLLGPDSAVVATAVADDSGQYVLRGQRSADYRLKLERIGYATRVTEPMKLSEGSFYNLPMQLAPSAVPIAPVTVKVEPRVPVLDYNGYYVRKKMGFGSFIDRTIIDKREGSMTSELFRGVGGVRLTPKSDTRGYHVILRGGIQPSLSRPRFCPALVWVDGVPVNAPDQSYNFELININDIEAIEVYSSPAQVPAQYNGASSACGVILLWRRTGG